MSDVKISVGKIPPPQKKYSENMRGKLNLINSILKNISVKKKKHYAKFSSLKTISGILKIIVNVLNALSVCSMVLTFSPQLVFCVIIALSSTTTSGILSAIITAYELEHKVHSHQTSYLQYVDIHRDVSARLFKNGLSSQDMDHILSELNARLGLIEDGSLPISVDMNSSKTPLL